MHRSVNEIAYAEGAFLLGFPISSQNRHSMRVSWALILLGITAVVPPNVQISAVIATQLRKACISQVVRKPEILLLRHNDPIHIDTGWLTFDRRKNLAVRSGLKLRLTRKLEEEILGLYHLSIRNSN